MRSAQAGSCRSCGAPILWIVMVSGKRMPLDAKPEKRIVMDGDEPVQRGAVEDCYTSHFATCPDAAKHRRER